jgi:glycosyltransferase involved in cell wall biosynthesis
MRIAQLAPLAESVPPKLYGGTERVVAWLVDELVELGHDVTLFASGDSRTKGELHAVWPRALRLGRKGVDPNAACAVLLEAIAKRAKDFDVIHAHIDWLSLPVLSRLGVPFVTTMHGRLDLPGLSDVLRQFPRASFVSISDHQRLPLPEANWTATIPHGLPSNNFRPSFDQGSYLAFLGRLTAEKGPRTPSGSRAPPECPCASPPRFRAARPPTSRSNLSPTSTAGRSSSSARWTRRRSSRSSPRPRPCCFRSTGRSLSASS